MMQLFLVNFKGVSKTLAAEKGYLVADKRRTIDD